MSGAHLADCKRWWEFENLLSLVLRDKFNSIDFLLMHGCIILIDLSTTEKGK